jgi:transposase
MVMLAERYDFVIGGDPDRDTIDLAILHASTGTVRDHVADQADGPGYQRLLAWARQHAPGRRVWALEGTGSFAAGLVMVLAEAGEDVVEVSTGKRTRGAKNDRIDAVLAARTALAQHEQAAPRDRGLREALRQIMVTRQAVLVSRTKAINELKSLIVVAPEHLRAVLRGLTLTKLLDRTDQLHSPTDATIEHRITILTLQSIAARIQFLRAQTTELDAELLALIQAHPAGPTLLAEPGVGPVVAAQLLVSWSHRGREATKPPSRPWPASLPWKPAADNAPGTDSAAPATATSTTPSTPSRSPAYAATPSHPTTKPNAPPKARPTATYDAASKEPSPATSTAASKQLPDSRRPPIFRMPVDKHRSVERGAADQQGAGRSEQTDQATGDTWARCRRGGGARLEP